ncbi:MAG: AAA family ATPase, partial [Hydrogenophaga sp.]|nr:AAA family ATPase [Hydrogenophaga sp.]
WDWTKKYPVIRISFGGGVLAERAALEDSLDGQFLKYEQASGLVQAHLSLRRRLVNLIEHLHQQTGQRVVVLVDEYDKPILDRIDKSPIATEMREMLKDIYSVLKDTDAHLKFVFLTGVSKFSKVSLFSGLNNLQDITLMPEYSALCGYTDEDVDTVFAPELPGLDREEVRRWYNGYNWLGTSVYNPFDLLLLFRNRKFKPYWFETGTPTFLIKLLAERQFFTPNLSQVVAHEKLLSTFDVDHIPAEALLFQTGYLTIHDSREPLLGNWVYTLGYPNREVESSLNMALLTGYGLSEQHALGTRLALIELLQTRNLAAMEPLFHTLFAGIPNDWYRKNPLAQFEGYYDSIFYSYFAALGLDIRLE